MYIKKQTYTLHIIKLAHSSLINLKLAKHTRNNTTVILIEAQFIYDNMVYGRT